MRVAILHNPLPAGARPDQSDLLAQAAAVRAALAELGHEALTVHCGLDLAAAAGTLTALRPDAVINLVEEFEGRGRLAHLAAAMLEHLGLPFTGSGSVALLTSHYKLPAKRLMAAAGLPTPPWRSLGDPDTSFLPGAYLVKSADEHASLGLDDACVVHAARPEVLDDAIRARQERFGGQWFAEGYVDGREFNLALLADEDGAPEALPPAEMTFMGYEDGRPRIVGYEAKWSEGSFAYDNTVRRFDLPASDAGLAAHLRATALACWRAFGLAGYARVDVRVGAQGQPWIIDVNANPCLSPDAGFAAAAAQAGLAYPQTVGRILTAARRVARA